MHPDAGSREVLSSSAISSSPFRTLDHRIDFPVIGPENALLRHALDAILSGASEGYDPLVLVGRDGCGKSHCLDFLQTNWSDGKPSKIVRWDGDGLSREITTAIDSDLLHRIHQRFETAALVLVDGLDRVTSREALTVFSALVDRSRETGGQTVVTLSHFPSEIGHFPPGLISRLSAGLVVSIRPPEADTRRQVVRSISERLGLSMEEEAVGRLAASDVSTDTIHASFESLAAGGCGRIEPRHAASIIAESTGCATPPTIRRIIAATARHYRLQPPQLLGPSRQKNIANARSAAIYLARRLTGKSLVEIGRVFGGRDHTTVLHSIKITKKRSDGDPACQRDLDAILADISS